MLADMSRHASIWRMLPTVAGAGTNKCNVFLWLISSCPCVGQVLLCSSLQLNHSGASLHSHGNPSIIPFLGPPHIYKGPHSTGTDLLSTWSSQPFQKQLNSLWTYSMMFGLNENRDACFGQEKTRLAKRQQKTNVRTHVQNKQIHDGGSSHCLLLQSLAFLLFENGTHTRWQNLERSPYRCACYQLRIDWHRFCVCRCRFYVSRKQAKAGGARQISGEDRMCARLAVFGYSGKGSVSCFLPVLRCTASLSQVVWKI